MTPFHVRGTVLPEGDVRDLWVIGDRVTFERPGGAPTVHDGGFLLPGLVDCHAHAGHEEKTLQLVPDELATALRRYAATGHTLLRMPGHRAPIPPAFRADPALPRLITAGEWLAWSGLDDVDGPQTTVDDLPAAALEQLRVNRTEGSGSRWAGGGLWVKTYGDWQPLKPATPFEVLRATCEAVHAAGGRVAIHCQTEEGVHNAVRAGADSIEHAWYLTESLVAGLAARGGAITPTWGAFAAHLDDVRDHRPDGPRRDWFLGGVASMAPGVRLAHEAGVQILAGTDSLSFGDVVSEVEWLVGAGLPAAVAVGAASWDARAFLGLPGLTEGAPADIVAYDTDPRKHPEVLRHPTKVILRGRPLTLPRT